jgi:5-methyltetrahydropteroyltriglutamate--homocysteine methyltransferase
LPLLFAQEDGTAVETETLERAIRTPVTDVVRKQAETGVDIVNDSEMGKISYASYVHERLTGFEGQGTIARFGRHSRLPGVRSAPFSGIGGHRQTHADAGL